MGQFCCVVAAAASALLCSAQRDRPTWDDCNCNCNCNRQSEEPAKRSPSASETTQLEKEAEKNLDKRGLRASELPHSRSTKLACSAPCQASVSELCTASDPDAQTGPSLANASGHPVAQSHGRSALLVSSQFLS